MTTKWTPGTWQQDRYQRGEIYSDGGRLIASTASDAWKDETRLANARLIAAAPMLASALAEAIGALEHMECGIPEYWRAALKTAEYDND